MHIGLIGGIGPAATDYYYRRIISDFGARNASLELTIVHADSSTLLANMAAGAEDDQTAIFLRVTERLAAAGAACVAVTSISGHFCIAPFKAVSSLPVIDLIETLSAHAKNAGYRRLGVLGTRTVMETRLYGGVASAEIVPPKGDDLQRVHDAYVAMAVRGSVTDAERALFHTAARRLVQDEGVEAVLLGGTDLALAFDAETSDIPIVDCAGVHVDAIVERALAGG